MPSFFQVCLCYVLSGAIGNVVTVMLIGQVADCEGSDPSC